MTRWTRRRFLGAGLRGLCLSCLGLSRGCAGGEAGAIDDTLADVARELVGDPASATRLARAWTGRRSIDEATARSAAKRIREALSGAAPTPASLRAQVRRDFATETIVRMRGWILSRTELELCVLAAASHTRRRGISRRIA